MFSEFHSLWASSPERSGGEAAKGRRACNYVSEIWISALKSRCERLIGRDDISHDVITLDTLIGGNLTALSKGSHRQIGGGIQIPETYLQALLPFPALPQERPCELACRLLVSQKQI